MSVATTFAKAIMKRSPGILAGLGIAGFIGTAIMVAKVTPKARLAVDDAITDKGEDLTIKEKAKVLAKHYWKPVIMGAASTAAVVGSVAAGAKQRAVIEAAYHMTATALSDQTEGIIEKYGKDALEAIQTNVSGKKIERKIAEPEDIVTGKKPINTIRNAIVTSADSQLYWDAWRGIPFESTPTKILSAVNEANRLLRRQDELTMNEFYACLETKHYDDEEMPCRMGDKFGWSNSLKPIELEYKQVGVKEIDGRMYIIMAFNEQPVHRLYS